MGCTGPRAAARMEEWDAIWLAAKERQRRALADVLDEATIAEIRLALGESAAHVYGPEREQGKRLATLPGQQPKRRGRDHLLTPRLARQLEREARTCKTYRELAQRCGVSEVTLCRWRKDNLLVLALAR
jgi:hypothetical protein